MPMFPENNWCIPVAESLPAGMLHFDLLIRQSDSHTVALIVNNNEVLNAGRWLETFVSPELEKLALQAQRVRRVYLGSSFTWIPTNFEADTLFLKKSLGKLPSDAIIDVVHFGAYGQLVSALPHGFQSAYTSNMFSLLETKSPLIHVHADDFRVLLSIFWDNSLRLHTSYQAETLSDLMYYILFSLDQLKLKADQAQLSVSGSRFNLEEVEQQGGQFFSSIQPLWDKRFPGWTSKLISAGFDGSGFEFDRFIYAYH